MTARIVRDPISLRWFILHNGSVLPAHSRQEAESLRRRLQENIR